MSSNLYIGQKRGLNGCQSQRQHGKTLTLNFTICSKTEEIAETTTEPINVNGLVLIRLKFQHTMISGSYSLETSLAFQRFDGAKFSVVQIKITTNHEPIQNKEWICSDEWVEVKLSPKKRDFILRDVVTHLEIGITAQEIKPARQHLNSHLKLYDDTELIDFHLRATDGTVGIHKAFLGIYDVFMTMFKQEWKETQEGEIAIHGVTKQTLQDLKQYIYLGTLPEDSLQLELLLVIATRYMMDDLKADCIAKMVQAITPEELCDLIEFACLNNLPDLIKAAVVETSDSIVPEQLESKMSKEKVKDETD